ncbi:MAG: dihydroneopterin aldolase [Chloroflexi bacterium]|nr:dihydroneopterin aldolase [Chloroflexota bacterium]
MSFFAYHGVRPEEQSLGQWFTVDLEVSLSTAAASASDAVEDAVNYSELYRTVKGVVEGRRYRLLETLAEAIAQGVLSSFPVQGVRVRVGKPAPPIAGARLKGVWVEIERPAVSGG